MLSPGEGLAEADRLLTMPDPITGLVFDVTKGIDEVLMAAEEIREILQFDMQNVPGPVRKAVFLMQMCAATLAVVARSLSKEGRS